MARLILASNSPRRKELLKQANLSFDLLIADTSECIEKSSTPQEVVCSLAIQKASAVKHLAPHDYIIGADTIVVHNGNILGKPKGEAEAKAMLTSLSGSEHDVLTGVAILFNKKVISFYERTIVTFYELTEEEIDSYIETKEPMDKAGAYGIQGRGALFVKQIYGDYYNVVGLPLSRTVRELKRLGFPSL